jgi:hypothetical protein
MVASYDTTLGFEHFASRIGNKLRRNLRRERNRLAKNHVLRLEHSVGTDRDINHQRLQEFLTIEASGWKGTRGKAIKYKEGSESYYTSLVEVAAAGGQVHWYQLLADECSIAMYLTFFTHRTVWASKTAYNAEFAIHSPGNELLYRIIEECCADPDIDELNLITNPAWIRKWRPYLKPYLRLRVFSGSPLGKSLYFLDRLRGTIGQYGLRSPRKKSAVSE